MEAISSCKPATHLYVRNPSDFSKDGSRIDSSKEDICYKYIFHIYDNIAIATESLVCVISAVFVMATVLILTITIMRIIMFTLHL